ncbi:LysR family transcriptional regulator [Pantoea sp. 18069]|uniref:LysR family transcriptional regulator n=1 Tax=Pantoea sp. 18069 TaxID=2681415 RepID=UPI0013567C66|nr:LysR family transcriptional regulator [Pantoea sp. 18069]
MNLNRFDLVSLRVFIAVMESGSLTAGARYIGLSLAATSKRIAELERHCGVMLMVRSKRGIAATPAGKSLLQHCIDVVTRVERLALSMDDFREGATGQLRIWANTSAFAGFLPPLLATYAKAHPGVSVSLEDALSEDAVCAINTGVSELAIIGENTHCDGLHTIVCDTDQLMLLVPQRHALAREKSVSLIDALACEFVSLAHSTSLTRHITSQANDVNRHLRTRVQVRSFDAMCHMVSVGLGVAIIPRTAALPHLPVRQLQLIELEDMVTERHLLLAMRDPEHLSRPASEFFAMAQKRHAEQSRAERDTLI